MQHKLNPTYEFLSTQSTTDVYRVSCFEICPAGFKLLLTDQKHRWQWHNPLYLLKTHLNSATVPHFRVPNCTF